jgi:BirA family biotin operon repressor/biotin-[acetyl-CoA-carboxylase] ligase
MRNPSGQGISLLQLSENINQVSSLLRQRIPVWDIVYHLEHESTQTLAKTAFKTGKNEKTLFLVRKQTQGRGRKTRKWISSPDGLDISMSLLIPVSKPLKNIAIMSLIGGISVVQTLREMTSCDFRVKWPNDIFFQDSKVGGIISELCVTQSNATVIMGIGLNVNSSVDEILIEEKFYDVRTVSSVFGHKLDLIDLIVGIVNTLEPNIYLLENCFISEIVSQFDSIGWRMGERVKFRESGRDWEEGIIDHISDEGYLVIVDDTGRILKTLIEGDISPGKNGDCPCHVCKAH